LEWLRARSDVDYVATDAGGIGEGLDELARKEVDVLAVNGGDGTLQRVLTEMLSNPQFERPPLVAPLRSGRTNMGALDIGSHRDPVRALETLLAAVKAGDVERRTTPRAVLRIELGAGVPVQYGLFIGFGTIHRAIELVHRSFPPGRAQGVFGSGIVTGLLIARLALGAAHEVLEPDTIDMRLDGEQIAQRDFVVAFASTLGRFFLGMRPFWGTEVAPVRFTAIGKGALGVGPAIDILRGRKPRRAETSDSYVSRNVHCGELVADCGLTIDGELYAPSPARTIRIEARGPIHFVRTD
jgi:hypothetical protein